MSNSEAIRVLLCCTDQNEHLGGWQKRFINPNIGSQLLRFAAQRSVGTLQVAHKLWDLLLEQRSKASRISMRSYLIAMQRRDPDPVRMPQVGCTPLKSLFLAVCVSMYKRGMINTPRTCC